MKKLSREQLVLKSVLLLRKVNRYDSKEKQLAMMDKYYSNEQLEDYIQHFNDPIPEKSYEEDIEDEYLSDDDFYTPSCTCRDYGPSNPWDAPGMSIHDFI